MTRPTRTAAVFFTTTTGIAATETVCTGLYTPYPLLTAICAGAAALLACLAAAEWTALTARKGPAHRAHLATPPLPRTPPIRTGSTPTPLLRMRPPTPRPATLTTPALNSETP